MEKILPIIAKIIDKSAAIVTLISAGIVSYLWLAWEYLMIEFTINFLTIAIVIVLLLILIPLEIIRCHRCTKEWSKIKEQYDNKDRECNEMKKEYNSVKSELSKAKEQYNNKDREYNEMKGEYDSVKSAKSELSKAKEPYDNKGRKYNEMKEKYDSFKSQWCYFINKCNIFQNGENILACYLKQENSYFTDTSRVNDAIEKCKVCVEYCSGQDDVEQSWLANLLGEIFSIP